MNKYILKASNEALEFIKINQLANILYKSMLLDNLYVIESQYDIDFFKGITGVSEIEEDYKDSLIN